MVEPARGRSADVHAARPGATIDEILARATAEMRLRGFSRNTVRLYSNHLRRFYRETAPDHPRVPRDRIRDYLTELIEAGRSYSYLNQAVSAIRFLYRRVLKAPGEVGELPRPKRSRTLPSVLNRDEVRRLIDQLGNPKHRAVVVLLYSAGLRVSEVLRLKVKDIDGERRQIHVRGAKGRKDRYVMLSDVALDELRRYWRYERPDGWLFPGERKGRHLHARSVQRLVARAARRAGIRKRVTPHTLRQGRACEVRRLRIRRPPRGTETWRLLPHVDAG